MAAYYEDSSLFPMEGGCSCGLIRYQVTKAPIVVHCCHCTSCQRESGAAFAINAIVESTCLKQLSPGQPIVPAGGQGTVPPAPAFPILAHPPHGGDLPDDDLPLRYALIDRPDDAPAPKRVTLPTQSGRGQSVARCPSCGVCVWSHYGGAGGYFAFVKVGTLDEAWRVNPDVHIYTRSKRPFVTLDDGAKQYEAFYAHWNEVYRPESIERWEKVWAEVQAYRVAAAERFERQKQQG